MKQKLKFPLFDEAPKDITLRGGTFDFDFNRSLIPFFTQKVKILIVVDGGISISPNGSFGVGRIFKLLNEAKIGCTEFTVDIAERKGVNPDNSQANLVINNAPGIGQAKYQNFRFDSLNDGDLILSKYHEMFLFGFAPDNFNGPDANISNHPWYTDNAELDVVNEWMKNGGGVFATGDHDYLGATMCHRIPRVGTMRKWTNDDGVPPISGSDRLDTNQPANSSEDSGVSTISNNNERDNVPQNIEWVPFRRQIVGFRSYYFPHELLCHPSKGIINIMPDHPHEGCCNETSEIDLTGSLQFKTEKEYPAMNGHQPKPKVIAYGNILSRNNLEKGSVNAKRFPMISVYDGRENNTSSMGRVVVDSTWHHWFNLNLIGLENDPNTINWDKISRYFVNIAKWIAPKNTFRDLCWWEIFVEHFKYPALREVNIHTPLIEVGTIVREAVISSIGPCASYNGIVHSICIRHPELCIYFDRNIKEIDPTIGPVCLTCPPPDLIETLIYGAIYREMEKYASEVKATLHSSSQKKTIKLNHKKIEELALKGIDKGVYIVSKQIRKETKALNKIFKTSK